MPDSIKVRPPWSADEPAASPTTPGGPAGWMVEPHYADAYGAYAKAKTPATAGRLLEAVQPVLAEAARTYAGGEANTPTVMAHAKRLALEAADRYDPTRAKLRTHLLSHLRGLRRQVARSGSPVYTPEAWRIDAQRLSASVPDLTDRLGRTPSNAEIADHTGLSLERVRKARAVPGVLASSQMEFAPESAKVDPEAWKTWTEAVYLDSHPIDQAIMDHSLSLHDQPVLSGNELAKKLGLSSGAISQRKAKIQQQLNEFETFMGTGR